ncbi:LysR family transcriptional regulator [Roseibium denhamense]|uniref:DNA-binding transcriptional regulator, LysR family n=1 Tax=Roseibium denhamense TaxID=76305 RepID=A0ABY1N9X8_9HYPH|nr:LysR family transcriptional regulator [Roseibium denhamense]MTI05987.1 LysR family transcriptional regulator [Roseibium denhamense]SMP02456.1 DNA-binding transcriptional regulator, LysR family [Roseibium denhamense]
MRQPVTSLPSLNCFRAAAERESFTDAAKQLNLTHGAISRAVRLLEEDLGTNLFERRNRRVFLTESGRELALAVAEGLDRIELAISRIKARSEDTPVTLSCEPTLLMRWLIPRLPGFQERHPEIELNLVAGGGPVSLGGGIDLAIRRNDFSIPDDFYQVPLFNEETGPVCRTDLAPRYFENGMPKADAPRLHTRTRPEAWAEWENCNGVAPGETSGQMFEHFYFSLQGAIAGLGVAIAPRRHVQDDIASGLLAAPAGFTPDGSSYVLLSRHEIDPAERAGKVLAWLHSLDRIDGNVGEA